MKFSILFARSTLLTPLLLASAACHRGDDGIHGVGTVEATEVDVAPMIVARVTRVLVDEGAAVHVGDTVATLTQAAASADIDVARGRLAGAEARLRDLEAGARTAEIQRASAELAAAQADASRTTRERERFESLAAGHDISAQQLDAARAAEQTAAARRDAASRALELLRQGARPEAIAGARAEVASAQAAVRAATGTARELVLTAPIDGVVLTRVADPGEVVATGRPVVTIADVAHPWIRVYVADKAVARVRVGQRATITLDGAPDQPAHGHVVAVNDHAEFTPRIALTDEERADLMFGVKVAIDSGVALMKPGLPATVRIAADSAKR